MKKLLTLLLCTAMMACSFAGCSSEKSDKSDNKKPEPTKTTETQKPEPTQEVPEEIVNEDGVEFTPDIENEGKIDEDFYDITSDKVMINGKTYDFPIRISELQENGWQLPQLTEDEIESKYTITLFSVSMEDEDGNYITLSELYNDSDETVPIEDALLTRFSISVRDYEKSEVDFVLPGGITEKSTAYDVLSIYGTPDEDNKNFDRAYSLETQLSYEKQKKSEIRYSFSFDEDGKVTYVTVSKSL